MIEFKFQLSIIIFSYIYGLLLYYLLYLCRDYINYPNYFFRVINTLTFFLTFSLIYLFGLELICDGIHVSYPAVRLLIRNKPLDKIVLVTDSLRVKHLDDGKYTEPSGQVIIKDGGVARLEDGTIAGSILKMNVAVKNLMDFTGISIIDAVKCATENPAKNLGVYDQMGSIKEGKLANLLVIDKNINIYKTIVNGFVLYEDK